MKFIKEWSEWNPVRNQAILDYIENNKTKLYHLWDNSISEEENIKNLVDYFTEYPDEMDSQIKVDNVKTLKPIPNIKRSVPILQNIGGLVN